MYFKPRAYQKLAIDHIIKHKRCALWISMGMGKSASVLAALDILSLTEHPYPALVIAPLRVAKTTWVDEIQKWDQFNDMRIVSLAGLNKKRMLKALKQKADIYTVNYETIETLVDIYGQDWPFKTIIADELTRLKSFRTRQGGKRARALASVAHKYCDRFIGLTGTPAPNGLKDLWGQMWFIDQGERLGRSFTAFSQRWFRKDWSGFNILPLPHANEEIQGRLKDVCLSIKTEDWFDLEKPLKTHHHIELPPKARKLYDQMEKHMYLELEEVGVEAFNAATKTSKLQQLCNGAIYTNEERDWEEIHDAKIQVLKSVIEEAGGMPVLVAYNFRSDLYRLRRAFKTARVLDKDPKTIHEWNEGKIPILLAHPASAGHGLNLQDGGNILVYFGLDWNLEYHEQIQERIGPVRQVQAGHKRNVYIHYILARDTVDDQLIMPRLETKRSVQEVLQEAMRSRKSLSTDEPLV